MRLNKVASEFNITWQRISEFLESVGSPIDGAVTPNARTSQDQYNLLLQEFSADVNQKQQSDDVPF